LSFWSSMFSKLLRRFNTWPLNGARAPAAAAVNVTPRSPVLLPGPPVV
jgi:hypothetical protein